MSHPTEYRMDIATNRRIIAIAIPMTLSQLTTPLLGIVATGVIGHLGSAELLGAIALGAVVIDFVFWGFGAFRMATAGLTAQAKGAGDQKKIDIILAQSLLTALCAGIGLILLQYPILLIAERFYEASPAVMNGMALYFGIRIWAAPFTLCNYVILGSVLGRARTDIGLLLQIAINLSNIALSLILVEVAGFGIAGVAIASVIAEGIGVIIGLAALYYLGSHPFRSKWPDISNISQFWHMLAVNRDIMIRTVCLMLAFALFSRAGAQSGNVALASNAVLYNMFLTGSYFLDGFATVAETLGGQSIGARNRASFSLVTRLCLIWCAAIGAIITLVFIIIGPWFIDTLSTNLEVRSFARDYLIFAALAPLIGSAAFVYDGIYIGATWSSSMRNLMLVSLMVFICSLMIGSNLGNTGLWLALLIFLGVRGIGQAILWPRLTEKTFAQKT